MSQSPIDDFSSPSVARYEQGWAALNKLLHQDRSFSSRERDCAFLNTGGERFADLSAAGGLDHPGDGRAVAAADWDFDGDADLWLTDRTAPRLRLLRNDNAANHHFVAVRLAGNGTTSNRNAIGARVTLEDVPGLSGKSIRTLHAGDAFLSQSTEWLHFGLGDSTDAGKLTVRWPDGAEETFANLAANQFYDLRQGTGVANPWTPPVIAQPWSSGTPEVANDATDIARIILPAPIPLPDAPYLDGDQKKVPLSAAAKGPLLVNLWATWCQPCIKELGEWSQHEKEFNAAGLHVLALHVDNPEAPESDLAAQQAVWDRLKCPFERGVATSDLVRSLDLLQRGLLDRWRPLPVPCSFLLDADHNLVAIYKGPVDVEQLFRDTELLGAAGAERRIAEVTPLGGLGYVNADDIDLIPIAEQFIDHGLLSAAISYLHSATRKVDPNTLNPTAKRRYADAKYVMGVLLRENQQPALAETEFIAALRYNPADRRPRQDLVKLLTAKGDLDSAARYLHEGLATDPGDSEMATTLGMVLLRQGQAAEAANVYDAALRSRPNDVALRMLLADSLMAAGEIERGLQEFRAVLASQPENASAANNLAWILATHPDDAIRNGAEAVRVAEAMVTGVGGEQPNVLDTLAAAYAECERFEEAAATAAKGAAIAQAAGQGELASKLERRRQQYLAHQPLRDTSLPKRRPKK